MQCNAVVWLVQFCLHCSHKSSPKLHFMQSIILLFVILSIHTIIIVIFVIMVIIVIVVVISDKDRKCTGIALQLIVEGTKCNLST